MEGGGNQRDLTVNLKLVADGGNQGLAKAVAADVVEAQGQIVNAETAASQASKERGDQQAQTAKSIINDLQRERAERVQLNDTAAAAAAKFKDIGQALRDNANSFKGFSDSSNAITLSLGEIRAEQQQLGAEAETLASKVQGSINNLGDAYDNLAEAMDTGSVAELDAAYGSLDDATQELKETSQELIEVEERLEALHDAEAKAAKAQEKALKDLDKARKDSNKKREADAKAQKALLKDLDNARKKSNRERAKAQSDYERARSQSAAGYARTFQHAKQLGGGLLQLARSYALATAASEEDADAALKQLAQIESTIQGIQGVVEIGENAIGMWKSYKEAKESAATAGEILGGVTTLGGAAKIGSNVLKGGGTGTALASLAVPAAAAAAALGSVVFAANSARETFSGAASSGKGFTAENIVDPIANATFAGQAMEVALNIATLGIYESVQTMNGTREAQAELKKSAEALAKAEKRRANILKELALKDARFERENATRTTRNNAALERGTFNAGRGLTGTAKSLAQNEAAQSILQQQFGRASAAAENKTGKTRNITKTEATTAKRLADELIKLKNQELTLAKQAASESIAGKQEELALSQKLLAAAERKRSASQAEVDSLAERLAFSSASDRRKLNRAAISARDGKLSLDEAEQLRGISQFQDLVQRTILQNALGKDDAGILSQARDQLKADAAAASKIEVNVNTAQTKLEVALTESEQNIEKLAEDIAKQIGPLINSKERNQEIIDKVIADIKAFQNQSN